MTPHFKTILKYLPQAEPVLFVQPFEILTPEAFALRFPGPNQTAVCTPAGFFFHHDFWSSLPPNKQRGLILHEVMHGVLGHLSDPFTDRSVPPNTFRTLANIAKDIVIEHSIWQINQKIQPHKPELERDILQNYPPERFLPYADLTWRQVYQRLRDSMKSGEGEGGLDMYGDAVCDSQSSGSGSGSVADPLADRWSAAAQEMEKLRERLLSQGNQAGAYALAVKPEPPVIPWQRHLVDYLVSMPAPVSRNWSRIKRRPFAGRGEYRASLSGSAHTMPSVTLLLDTSGSMSGDYNEMAGEVLAICSMAQQIHRVDYDVGIAFEELIDDPEGYEITTLHGGGGTCIRTTLRQLVERPNFNRAAPVVVLTDGGDNYDVADLGVACVFLTYGCMFRSDAGPVFQVERAK